MGRARYWGRRLVPVAVILLLLPVAITGLSHDPGRADGEAPATAVSPANLTVVTTQGGEPRGDGIDDGVLEGVRTDDRSVVFVHDSYEMYYDVDPIDDETLLFVAHERGADDSLTAYAVEWNWVTNETERRFRVPYDTHDVDRVDEHEYVVADKVDHRAYVYNYTADDDPKRSTDEMVWEYRFSDHYPTPPEAGEEGDYTHLNDVDVEDDGETFVLSPRNFNRVVAVDRETKETAWTLGEQDDRSILFRQHDPIVIEADPLTVLVGDSRNNRVVEYQRVDGEWEQTWGHGETLNWPRNVNRLPSGNTLIADTGNNRVVEVAPNGSVVWQHNTTHPNPYDMARVEHGDQPKGPTMAELAASNETDVTETPDVGIDRSPAKFVYRIATWPMPTWVGPREFAAIAAATLLTVAWSLYEIPTVVRNALRAYR